MAFWQDYAADPERITVYFHDADEEKTGYDPSGDPQPISASD
jgi:hypothetical protein